MVHTLRFDSKSSIRATGDREYDEAVIMNIQRYINEVLKCMGYVYLNRIYEQLGIEWNPLWENYVYIYDRNDPRLITFSTNFFEVDENLTIDILY